MRIGIIGGGMTGLAAAHYLSGKGHEITLFERERELGGLASSFSLGDSFLERYYHHIFTSDREIMGLISALGLEERVISRESRMGVFHNGKAYPFGTPLDLLRFRPFGPLDKLRFGLTILYLNKLGSWKKLENASAREWMTGHAGRSVFNVIWKPLLEAKFGDRLEDISMAWLWGRIKARAGSRSRGMIKEELGYLRGGFKALIEALEGSITGRGGRVMKACPVRKIMVENGRASGLLCSGKRYGFDRIISTVPLPVFLELAPGLPEKYAGKIRKIKYQSVVCMVLKLDRPLSDFYWLNISDPQIPFGLMAEHTNLFPDKRYGGSVLYLSNYLPSSHKIYRMAGRELLALYRKGLERICPGFRESWVEEFRVFRDRYATPVYTRNYSRMIPGHTTPLKNLYLANTSQIYPEDRNMNSSIRLGKGISGVVSRV